MHLSLSSWLRRGVSDRRGWNFDYLPALNILSDTFLGHAGDRNNLNAWHNGDNLVQRVASVNSRTVVVVNSVGPIIMESWITNPNGTCVQFTDSSAFVWL